MEIEDGYFHNLPQYYHYLPKLYPEGKTMLLLATLLAATFNQGTIVGAHYLALTYTT